MAIAPFAAYYFVQSRRAEKGRHDFQAANAGYDVGTVRFEDVYNSSTRLRDAELALPFANRRAVRVAYLNRVAHLEKRVQSMLLFAMPGGENTLEEWKEQLEALRTEREGLERGLGVKAAE
jgi:hypothetical protein